MLKLKGPQPMLQSKLPQTYARLALKITCAVTLAFSGASLRAEMYQCVGPDGSKTFSDLPCPSATKGTVMPKRAGDISGREPSLEALVKSSQELELARKAEDDAFHAGFDGALGPKCSKLFKIVNINANKNLSSEEVRAANNEYGQLGCEAKANLVRATHAKKSEAMWQRQQELYKEIQKRSANLPRGTARTPECRKLAGQAASIFLNGVSSEGQFRMYEQATKMMEAQKCDDKLFGEAMEANLAAQKAEMERLEKNPCEMKRRLQDALRLRQSGNATSGKSDIDYLEKQISELAKKCP
jgi:hypothetical protein